MARRVYTFLIVLIVVILVVVVVVDTPGVVSFRRPRTSSDLFGRRADVPSRRCWQSVAEHRDARIVQACYNFHSWHATCLFFFHKRNRTRERNRRLDRDNAFQRGRFRFPRPIVDDRELRGTQETRLAATRNCRKCTTPAVCHADNTDGLYRKRAW